MGVDKGSCARLRGFSMPAWTKNTDRYPEPHRKYLVQRYGWRFVGTPCYGMHTPWWVAAVADHKEVEPVNMLDDDKWIVLDEVAGG